jgi:dienelactone hydrolase
MEIHKFSPLADKYGMIVLAATAHHPGMWDLYQSRLSGITHAQESNTGTKVSQFREIDVRIIDSAMKQVLATEAIDPHRIAVLGFSNGGGYALFLGRSNEDIFSRVVSLSAAGPYDGTGPKNPQTQYAVSGGIAELGGISMLMLRQTLKLAQVLRREGHAVMTLVGLRGHEDLIADEDVVWAWLKHSWADPRITAHPPMPADSDPVLTVAAMHKMTAFWTRFTHEPDSILNVGRMAHQEQRWMALGDQPASVITTNMVALAQAYPSVAADLKAAGLTAHQEAAYRVAILRVGFVRAGGIVPGPPDPYQTEVGNDLSYGPITPNSVLAKNLAFRASHNAEFAVLSKTGMWTTQ